jgi:NAD(P)H-hydrate epimerase
VLSGIVGNLLGSGLKPSIAAASGAWIHGMAGRIVEKTAGSEGVLASEIAGAIPEVLRELASQISRH